MFACRVAGHPGRIRQVRVSTATRTVHVTSGVNKSTSGVLQLTAYWCHCCCLHDTIDALVVRIWGRQNPPQMPTALPAACLAPCLLALGCLSSAGPPQCHQSDPHLTSGCSAKSQMHLRYCCRTFSHKPSGAQQLNSLPRKSWKRWTDAHLSAASSVVLALQNVGCRKWGTGDAAISKPSSNS